MAFSDRAIQTNNSETGVLQGVTGNVMTGEARAVVVGEGGAELGQPGGHLVSAPQHNCEDRDQKWSHKTSMHTLRRLKVRHTCPSHIPYRVCPHSLDGARFAQAVSWSARSDTGSWEGGTGAGCEGGGWSFL